MRFFLLIAGLFFFLCGNAENKSYSTFLIADSLSGNANAVIRYDSISYHLITPGMAELKRHKVVTILNRHGESFAQMYVMYDRNSKVTSFSGEVLDAKGERIRKIKKDEITDNSLVANYTLFQDDRYMIFEALNNSYPYTIVFDYSLTYDGIVSIDRWVPVPGYNVSVEKSVFTLISENNQPVNFKKVNLPVDCQTEPVENSTVFHWEISNIKAFDKEPFSPSFVDIFPILWTTPEKFEYEETVGEFKSWKSFGEWEWNLLSGKQDVSETTQNEIRDLIKNAGSDKEKVSLIYKYFQNRTRYVSVQLGIGGWQPFPASVVDEVGYGDCKALSNYMVSLLKVAGIKSIYSVIGNGDSKIMFTDFPSMGQANHVIVCVPFEKDTTWLECTSQEYPLGYIGLGNNDRYALLITEEGGKLVKTPSLDKNENRQIRKAEVVIDEVGNAEVKMLTEFSGLQYGNRNFLLTESKEEQKKWYLNNFEFNMPELNSFQLSENKTDESLLEENLDLYLPKYSTLTGPRLFLKPNIINTFPRPPSKSKTRKFGFEREFAYTDSDSIVYKIPEGFILESKMGDLTIENEFGKYSMRLEVADNQLIYLRKLEMNKGTWPAEKYEDYYSFYSAIWKADQSKVVLVKK